MPLVQEYVEVIPKVVAYQYDGDINKIGEVKSFYPYLRYEHPGGLDIKIFTIGADDKKELGINGDCAFEWIPLHASDYIVRRPSKYASSQAIYFVMSSDDFKSKYMSASLIYPSVSVV